jgi:hypothetical protein
MILDTQTTIFMTCFVYLILHGAIWLALQEYRSEVDPGVRTDLMAV